MTESPLFSVLIANYNNGCYMMDAVQSILGQSYGNWEMVIVDDDSTDNSSELYRELSANPRIRIFHNDRNHGTGYTKRRCVTEALGEVCGFVDPDDMLAKKEALEIMVQAHREHPDASIIYSGFYVTDENLNVIGESRGIPLYGSTALESLNWPYRHFISFKKAKYDLTVGIDPLMKRCVDYDMYYKLEEVGENVHIDQLLYYYRRNTHSISLNSDEYKSRAWHTYACVEAMKRRGKTDEKLMLFPIEDALRRAFNKGVEHGKNTKTYKIGEFLLKPFKFLGG